MAQDDRNGLATKTEVTTNYANDLAEKVFMGVSNGVVKVSHVAADAFTPERREKLDQFRNTASGLVTDTTNQATEKAKALFEQIPMKERPQEEGPADSTAQYPGSAYVGQGTKFLGQVDWKKVGENGKDWVQEHPYETAFIVVGGVTLVAPGLVFTPILNAAGLAANGPRAASGMQRVSGPLVAKGVFATAQSAGMGGYGTAVAATVTRVGVLATAAGAAALRKSKEAERSQREKTEAFEGQGREDGHGKQALRSKL